MQAKQQDDLPPSEMTLQNALDLLGVREGASFDDILRAKKRITDAGNVDQEMLLRVEAAYDILLMQSLSRRRAGEGVATSVRFADVPRPKPPAPPSWLQSALRASPVAIERPSDNQTLAVQSAVFASLFIWTYTSGLGGSGSTSGSMYDAPVAGGDVPGLQLALAFGYALYELRKDGMKMGKAAGVSVAGLVAGAILGGLVQSWLRVDIFPVLGNGSPAVLVGEFSVVALWLAAVFVR